MTRFQGNTFDIIKLEITILYIIGPSQDAELTFVETCKVGKL